MERFQAELVKKQNISHILSNIHTHDISLPGKDMNKPHI